MAGFLPEFRCLCQQRNLPNFAGPLLRGGYDRPISPHGDSNVGSNAAAAWPSGDASHSCSSCSFCGRRPLTPSKMWTNRCATALSASCLSLIATSRPVLESFEQVTGHGHVVICPLLNLNQLAPTGNEPLALGNAPIGMLHASSQRVQVVTRRPSALRSKARCYPRRYSSLNLDRAREIVLDRCKSIGLYATGWRLPGRAQCRPGSGDLQGVGEGKIATAALTNCRTNLAFKVWARNFLFPKNLPTSPGSRMSSQRPHA